MKLQERHKLMSFFDLHQGYSGFKIKSCFLKHFGRFETKFYVKVLGAVEQNILFNWSGSPDIVGRHDNIYGKNL